MPAVGQSAERLYAKQGKDAQFMTKPREHPEQFHRISTFEGEKQVKTARFASVNMGPTATKVMERLVRLGVASSSYSMHFMDGVKEELMETKRAVDLLDPTPQAKLVAQRLAMLEYFFKKGTVCVDRHRRSSSRP